MAKSEEGVRVLRGVYAKAFLLVEEKLPDEEAKNKLAMLLSYWQNLKQPANIKSESCGHAALELTGRVTQHGEIEFYGVPIDPMVTALNALAGFIDRQEASSAKRKATLATKGTEAAPEEE
jgi:hypothetical protein